MKFLDKGVTHAGRGNYGRALRHDVGGADAGG